MAAQIFRKLGRLLAGFGATGNTGSRQSVIDLYDRLRPSLRVYLCCLGLSVDQAESVIQDTFLRLVRQRFLPKTGVNLRAWIFRVAHDLSVDAHRSRALTPRGDWEATRTVILERVVSRSSPELQVPLDERMKRLEASLAQLAPVHRQCVLLRAGGFRYREIALTLGISAQRVGELMQRSISSLEVHS